MESHQEEIDEDCVRQEYPLNHNDFHF